MAKNLSTCLVLLLLGGCASQPVRDTAIEPVSAEQQASHERSGTTGQCRGSTELPARMVNSFSAAYDETLLDAALGQANAGKLCQGKVYQSAADARVTIFRAWNSTNPNSKMGKWWAFRAPKGEVSQYRSDYAICHHWSPLDMLVRCKLKPGTKVVVGTGQSAECSKYLTYPTSDEKQIYIEDASAATSNCVVYEGKFRWKPAATQAPGPGAVE